MNIQKPNFFLVGLPRSGTNSMYTYLKSHPDIFMSPFKEPHFFGKDLHRGKRCKTFSPEKYSQLFSSIQNQKILGEASIFYFYSRTAAEEIHTFNPSAKCMLIIRNPIDTIYSLHSLNSYNNIEQEPFQKAVSLAEEREKNLDSIYNRNYYMGESLLYKNLIKRIPACITEYQKLFKENFKIVFFEDLKKSPETSYKNILDFLGINNATLPEFEVHNSNPKAKLSLLHYIIQMADPLLLKIRSCFSENSWGIIPAIKKWNRESAPRVPLDPTLEKELRIEFKPTIQEIEKLTGRDLSEWYRL